MTIQRLVLDFRGEGGDLVVVRCLYHTQDGPNQGTKARTKVGSSRLGQARPHASSGGPGWQCRVRRPLRLRHPGGCSFDHNLTGCTRYTKASEIMCGVSYLCLTCKQRIKHAVPRPDGPQDALRDTLPRCYCSRPGLREAKHREPAEVVLHVAHPRSCGTPAGRISCLVDSYKVGDSGKA
jgi:hypothetical protein